MVSRQESDSRRRILDCSGGTVTRPDWTVVRPCVCVIIDMPPVSEASSSYIVDNLSSSGWHAENGDDKLISKALVLVRHAVMMRAGRQTYVRTRPPSSFPKRESTPGQEFAFRGVLVDEKNKAWRS
jgi:hypothetical protein